MKNNIDFWRCALVALLTCGSLGGANAERPKESILVGGTDFEPVNSDGKFLFGPNEIKMTGALGGSIKFYVNAPEDLGYDYNANNEAVSSHFHDGEYMAIVDNPVRLDSLHYLDDNTNDWGVVWGRIDGSENKTILTYSLEGLKQGTPVEAKIKFRSVIDPESKGYSSLRNCYMYYSEIRAALNHDYHNMTYGFSLGEVGHGMSKESIVVDNNERDNFGFVTLNVNMPVTCMNSACTALEITSIEVYGQIDPKISCETYETICVGERAYFKSDYSFNNVKYQWYVNGTAVAGATSSDFYYEPAETGSYIVSLTVDYEGTKFKSNNLELNVIKCCEMLNSDGESVSTSRKVIFKEDFGEIDLSDTTGTTYKVWDYSDISNPVQVTKKSTTPFRYELDYNPLGCTFNNKGPISDGEYTVAGVLTGYNSYGKYEGAKLEWANRIGGVYNNGPIDLSYDHSGKLEGCCLFVNCKDKTAGKNIYERVIENLCQNRLLSLETYISVFTDAAAGTYQPVDVTIKLTEIGNESNTVSVRGTTTREKDGGKMWERLSCNLFLEKGDAVRIEIVNNNDYAENGNDLVIDDITLYMCSAPSLQTHLDKSKLIVDPTELLVDYYGGDRVRYLYQWSKTPNDKKSWKSVGNPTKNMMLSLDSALYKDLTLGDTVYTRVIVGSEYALSLNDYYNADEPCAAYSISDPVKWIYDEEFKVCENPVANISIKVNQTTTESISMTAELDTKLDSPTFIWYVNGIPFLRASSGPVDLGINVANNGIVSVYAQDINGCTTDTAVYEFDFSSYCQDANGNKLEKVLVWKEDFGEIDLSDTTGTTYKVWDYSDISNPVQVTKKTPTPFRYKLDYNPLGCTFNNKGPILEGEYTVAGVLTGYAPYDKYEGAKLEWANRIGGVNNPTDLSYDHSGKLEGCCLFVNSPNRTKDDVIYSIRIIGLGSNVSVSFECFISVFTNSASGPYNPVDVVVKLTDIGNGNTVSVRGTTTREKDGGKMWERLSCGLFLEGGEVEIEIISNTDVSENGNDLVIDDLKLFACGMGDTTGVKSESSVSADPIVNVYTVSGALIKSNVKRSEALNGLENGVYLVGGEKVVVKK